MFPVPPGSHCLPPGPSYPREICTGSCTIPVGLYLFPGRRGPFGEAAGPRGRVLPGKLSQGWKVPRGRWYSGVIEKNKILVLECSIRSWLGRTAADSYKTAEEPIVEGVVPRAETSDLQPAFPATSGVTLHDSHHS